MFNDNFFEIWQETKNNIDIEEQELIQLLESSFSVAYKKELNTKNKIKVTVDTINQQLKVYELINVDQKTINNDVSIENNVIEKQIDDTTLSRSSSTVFKNIFKQQLSDFIFNKKLQKAKEKNNTIIMCVIKKITKNIIYAETINDCIECIMDEKEKIKTENYYVGQKLIVYVKTIKCFNKNIAMIISRSSPELVKLLLELEVPEIKRKLISVVDIARLAGIRTKIALATNDDDIDPIGACLGVKNIRALKVSQEFNNEKIDFVVWDKDKYKYLKNLIKPNVLIDMIHDRNNNKITITVSKQSALNIIGKNGQNIKLISKLLNISIDVKICQEEN